jgi:23S rRNA (uracil1939-C5)-methyltransferase
MDIRIDRLGARGDGIADTDDGPVYVPFGLPGEAVTVNLGKTRGDGRSATLREVVSKSADRQEPACRHFGPVANACGGCAVQHLGGPAYAGWKRDMIAAALGRHGLDAEIEPVISVSPASRRRIRLAFRKLAGGMLLGFHEARSDRIVDIAECPVALPEIVTLIPRLRDFLSGRAGRADQGEVAITQTAEGADVVVFSAKEPDLDTRMDAPEFCEAAGVARLSWSAKDDSTPEPVLTLKSPTVRFGNVSVRIPPDSFLQPTETGEAALQAWVLRATDGSRTVADLYAGCGAFSFPMAAAGKTVTAYEGVAGQITALRAAAAGRSLSGEIRDLARQPLRADDLARFDAVVLDPPRGGAAPQIGTLAGSDVPLIAYVSCNPATFARDARVLVDGGYVLGNVQPVDQFLWSPHVELAGIFQRN